MLGARVLTALVGCPVLLGLAWIGGPAFLAFLAVLAVLAAEETCRLFNEDRPHRGLVWTGVLIIMTGAYFLERDFPGPLPVGLFLFYLLVMVVRFPRFTVHSFFATIIAAAYPSFFAFLFLLRERPGGWEWILFALFATWAFDTLGYFVGLTLGRKRIAPRLSPKKSLEGLIGGLLGSVLIAYIFYLLAGAGPPGRLLVMGLLVGIGAQFGDLAASAFKRFADVKDTGSLLPGHGGILDRFDSLLFTSPLVYYLIDILGVTVS